MDRNRILISRAWETYMMKATLAESKERPWPIVEPDVIEKHRKAHLPGHEAHILRLPQPILCKTDEINDIFHFEIDGKSLRIYPPFKLNEIAENAGAFTNVWIPEGETKITYYKALPSTVSRAFTSTPNVGQGVFFCQGLRVDYQAGAPEKKVVELLLEQICQYTHQWWLRAGTSPFNGLERFGAEINRDHLLREELRYAGAREIESTWYIARQTQQLMMGKPLDSNLWLLCCHHVSKLRRGDAGILAFHDAIAAYMAEDDVRCLLNLSVCFEILGNKRRILLNQKATDANELIRTTDLVEEEATRSVLKKLFIDRGHVAHGREPHLLGLDKGSSIESYIEAVRNVLSGYIRVLKPGEWPSASQLSVKRK